MLLRSFTLAQLLTNENISTCVVTPPAMHTGNAVDPQEEAGLAHTRSPQPDEGSRQSYRHGGTPSP